MGIGGKGVCELGVAGAADRALLWGCGVSGLSKLFPIHSGESGIVGSIAYLAGFFDFFSFSPHDLPLTKYEAGVYCKRGLA